MAFFDFSVASVLPTFFTDDNSLDFDSMKNVVEYQINQGIKNMVILGTTSETPTLNDEEKFSLVKYFYENFGDKLKFIVGVGGNDTIKTIENVRNYEQYAHAYLATVPYYNKPNQKGMELHFSAIAETTNKPIMLYNVPSRTGSSIDPETVTKLYKKHHNIQAIKEASGNLDQVQKIICGSDIKVYSGDDSLTLPIMSIGGQGVVSVASNVIPQMMLQFTNSIKDQSNIGNRIEFNKMIYQF
jgi:4-hydroxy-tetrahydrodipicolinate synthase